MEVPDTAEVSCCQEKKVLAMSVMNQYMKMCVIWIKGHKPIQDKQQSGLGRPKSAYRNETSEHICSSTLHLVLDKTHRCSSAPESNRNKSPDPSRIWTQSYQKPFFYFCKQNSLVNGVPEEERVRESVWREGSCLNYMAQSLSTIFRTHRSDVIYLHKLIKWASRLQKKGQTGLE